MTWETWLFTVSAVFVGCGLAVTYGYFIWRVAKADRKHKGDPDSYRKAERELEWWVWVIGLLPLPVAYLLTHLQ